LSCLNHPGEKKGEAFKKKGREILWRKELPMTLKKSAYNFSRYVVFISLKKKTGSK